MTVRKSIKHVVCQISRQAIGWNKDYQRGSVGCNFNMTISEYFTELMITEQEI